MQITALIRGKKSRRINIFIEDEYSFSVEETTLIREGLYKGKELSQEEVERIKINDLVQKFILKCMELIGRRPRSKKEIVDYLNKKLGNNNYYDISKEELQNVVDGVVEKLITMNYLNDQQFAEIWIRNRLEFRPRSKQLLRSELIKKGIGKEVIDPIILENFGEDKEVSIALDIAKKKLSLLITKGLSNLEIKKKISMYLGAKGYRWDVISKIFKLLELSK